MPVKKVIKTIFICLIAATFSLIIFMVMWDRAPIIGGEEVFLISLPLIAYLFYLSLIFSLVYKKAGEPRWALFVPFYNLVVLLRIANKPDWWILLYFIPVLNLYASLSTAISVLKRFDKGIGFLLGLSFLPIIFIPIIAYDSSEYVPQNSDLKQNNSAENISNEIIKFEELLNAGTITQEEFDAKKKELLGI